MPIDATCPGCAKTYRIKDEQAGKRVKCPQCGAVVEVPNPQAEKWYLYTATGEQFGPVPKSELDRWVEEGAVDAECQVLKEGDADWRWAGDVYPELVDYQLQGGPATPAPAASVQAATQSSSLPLDYRRLLTPKGQVHSLINMMVNGDCQKSQHQLVATSTAIYQVGEMRSWWEQAKHGATFGPFAHTKSIHVDYLNTFRIAAPRGDFHLILPMDGATPCPVEFAAVVPGRLPVSVALIRGRGGNVGVEVENSMAGAFIPRPLTAIMKATGGTAESNWITAEGRVDHPLVAALEQANLKVGSRWDGQITMGNTRITYKLAWSVQAIPLGNDHFLLVAKNVPKNRLLMGFDLHLDWFVQIRDIFGFLAHQNRMPGDGAFRVLDPGNWYAYVVEVMGLRL
jgi:predicted Zn finger-like uncharacterized protein